MEEISEPSGLDIILAACENKPAIVASRLSTPERECSRQNVEYWIRQGYVTPGWAPRANLVFGVPLHKLNPRVYPPVAAAT